MHNVNLVFTYLNEQICVNTDIYDGVAQVIFNF